ncbi:MAG TPA: 4-hydroxy-tetrahydrodipicolinate synthase [Thermoanaerobaculia bacterium]|nr:4-hydroxy-tetrahydrodipicolinate synthase [Thermoanaerobaculia bacterium]
MSETRARFGGVYTALVTPFTGLGHLDEAALRRTVRRQIEGGVAGLVPMGTTGEAVTVAPDEHRQVVEWVAEEARSVGRPVQVLAGCGSNDTGKTVDTARLCRDAGADALLVVTPYYNKPPQRGLADHFRRVADEVDLPVVLYNVPGRTGSNLLPETVLELAEDPRFAAVKEASGNLDQVSAILAGRPEGFAVLSGEDSLTLPIVALGGDGVIAVVSNEAPALLVELVEKALAGDRAGAAALHARLLPLMRANFVESNPIPVKWAMARLGLMEGYLRPPLSKLDAKFHATVEAALQAVGLLDEEGGERAAAGGAA